METMEERLEPIDIVLVPGLWLDASSWDKVVPLLERAGHRARALTLPGLESRGSDRAGVGTADHVAAVVAAVDEAAAASRRPVLLVGHSLGSAIAWGALDARVEKVAKVVFIGGWPAAGGKPLAGGFPTDGPDLPPAPWEGLGDDVRDLDRREFESYLRPSPARLTTEGLALHDERRYDVPALFVCPEFTAAQLQEWVADGEESVSELPRLRKAEYVDLPTGHWPQLSKPEELAAILLDAAQAV